MADVFNAGTKPTQPETLREYGAHRVHGEVLCFGDFTLEPSARLLTKAGEPVKLGARAMDLLVALVEHAGRVLSKNELFATVWPNTAIEDSNLRVNIAALRKALGEDASSASCIISVPGRGYLFSFTVIRRTDASSRLDGPPFKEGASRALDGPAFMVRNVRIFGRDDDVVSLTRDVANGRLVTITGPGGVGKTTVAQAVVDAMAATFKDGALAFDLCATEAGRHIPSLLASHFRLPAAQRDPLPVVIAYMRSRHMLLLLDNCEHLVEAVAPIVEAILSEAPGIHILATSREPLRVQGEYARRLSPLAFPTIVTNLALDQIRQYPAVQLLEERVLSCNGRCLLAEGDAEAAVEICTKLDGLPLAIELAAARVPTLGWSGVVQRLDQPFKILTRGLRTAAARHQSLKALIDWSYETLPDAERIAWTRLAVFRNEFSVEAADAVANDVTSNDYDIVDILQGLAEKSLVSVDLSSAEPKYRLLESLRLYAWEKLLDGTEADSVRQRHAEYWCRRSAGYGDNWIEMPSTEWLARYRGELADVRAAIDWAISPSGDADLGIRLISASAPLWFKLLLLPELTAHLEHAIACVPTANNIDRRIVMRLYIALAHSIFHALGPVPDVDSALDRALELADEHCDTQAQCQIVWAQFGHYSTRGDYGPMMRNVERARLLAAQNSDTTFAATHDRIAALGFHLLGKQDRARDHGLRALGYAAIQRHDGGFVYDHRTASSSHVCRIHWIMGDVDKSRDMIRATIARALDINQPFAFGYFLVFCACPIAIWSGDRSTLRAHVALLTDAAIGIPRTVWRISGEFYQRVLEYLEEQEGMGKEACREALLEMPLTRSQAERLATFHWKLLRPELIGSLDLDAPNWCTAEVLRAQGEALLMKEGHRASSDAEALFRRALDIARSQKAASWELRAAASLARLKMGAGDAAAIRDSNAILASAAAKIDQTQVTVDLAEAHSILARTE